ncbi:hypothetical protein [Pararhizobium sp.]|uniref:hypothetical protein n=1 Tax=Pararhizobium sp. TaxID=1977563 RepID=UPI00272477AD|nr:hypothetical protein [Pararhizobium sp.]MDO9418323.1 hypothetical protein [Pararhizobium sp.]
MPSVKDLISSPSEYFKTPADVAADTRLSDNEKKKILDAWENDQKALDVSADEGMLPEPGEKSEHNDIKKAIRSVEKHG